MFIRGKRFLILSAFTAAALGSLPEPAQAANCKAFCAQVREHDAKNPACKMTVIRASSSICGCKFETPDGEDEQVGGVCAVYARKFGNERAWQKVNNSWADSSCGYWSNQGIPAFCAKDPGPAQPAEPVAKMAPISAEVPAKPKELRTRDFHECYRALSHLKAEDLKDAKKVKANEPMKANLLSEPKYVPTLIMPRLPESGDVPPPGIYVSAYSTHLRLPYPKESLAACGGKTFYRIKYTGVEKDDHYKTDEFGIDWKAKGPDKKSYEPAVLKSIPAKLKDNKQCVMDVSFDHKTPLDNYGNWDEKDRTQYEQFLIKISKKLPKERICAAYDQCVDVIDSFKLFATDNCSTSNAEALGIGVPAPAKGAVGAK